MDHVRGTSNIKSCVHFYVQNWPKKCNLLGCARIKKATPPPRLGAPNRWAMGSRLAYGGRRTPRRSHPRRAFASPPDELLPPNALLPAGRPPPRRARSSPPDAPSRRALPSPPNALLPPDAPLPPVSPLPAGLLPKRQQPAGQSVLPCSPPLFSLNFEVV